MRAASFVLCLCACSNAPAVAAPSVVATNPLPISCHGGRELVYSRNLPDGTSRTVDVICTDERVTASSWLTRPEEEGLDMSPIDSGLVEIDRAAFERVWRAVISGRCDRAKPTRSSLVVKDLHEKRSVTCANDDSWSALFQPIEPAVTKPPSGEDLEHLFNGDEWRDELGYYRR